NPSQRRLNDNPSFAPKRHCGSWVNRALKMPAIKRIVTADNAASRELLGRYKVPANSLSMRSCTNSP
ncbi:hypothetical protein, partial [Klebsiella pneumoniae]|uniref:hypothetical protein n=1 Tax=Klebsiella pneumoniae TaxID=573 RepID=UPI0039C47979